MPDREIIVGVISDTHGLLRPAAIDALRGSDLIIHAGDVGAPEVLDTLRGIAPTFAVRGNVDTAPWAAALPVTERVAAGARSFFVLHEISQLGLDPGAAGLAAVVYGHSHMPSIETRGVCCSSTRGAPARAASSCRSRSRGCACPGSSASIRRSSKREV